VALDETARGVPGEVTAVQRDAIHVATGRGVLAIYEIQAAGGRRMPVAQYLTGHPIGVGMRLSAHTQ